MEGKYPEHSGDEGGEGKKRGDTGRELSRLLLRLVWPATPMTEIESPQLNSRRIDQTGMISSVVH